VAVIAIDAVPRKQPARQERLGCRKEAVTITRHATPTMKEAS